MIVQFNLLPDVKLEYIKARRLKRTVMGISIVATSIALTVFVGLFMIVNVVQKQHISNLNTDIEKGVADLKQIPDIDKVLTVQNQLASLPDLHAQKPAASRSLDYLGAVTPAKASIADVSFDFEGGTIRVTGSADSLVTVNKFTDTLKFTTYTSDVNASAQPAFSEVVLTSFGVDNSEASFQIDFKFNAEIFDNTKTIKLSVPDIISTRSQTEKPSDLFKNTSGSGAEE